MLAVSRLEGLLEKELELDRYRREVERLLGTLIHLEKHDDYERFFHHVEACFDCGVPAGSCARTWTNGGEGR
jgi:hypothetical protein